MELQEKLKLLPECPGVYLMQDSVGIIIYVGKSKNLKKRVMSYFTGVDNYTPKLENLMRNMCDFSYITTDTEFEALMLECALIGKYKPAYNRQMKNPKSYCYARINYNADLPDVDIVQEKDESGGYLYFGPYNSKSTLRRSLETAQRSLGILCSAQSRRNTPCLNSELGLCNGICIGKTSRQEYMQSIQKIIGLMDGSSNELIDTLNTEMVAASEAFEFETAAILRDKLKALRYAASRSRITKEAAKYRKLIFLELLNGTGIKLLALSDYEIIYAKHYAIEEFNLLLEDAIIQGRKLYNSLNTTSDNIDEKYKIDKLQIITAYLSKPSDSVLYQPIDKNYQEAAFAKQLQNIL